MKFGFANVKLTLLRFLGGGKIQEFKLRRRIHGRRQLILSELLQHKWLDHYEISRRTGIPHQDVSKLLATAMRDQEHIERIKRKVEVPSTCRKMKKSVTIWVYRLKAPIIEVIHTGTVNTEDGVKTVKEMAESVLDKMEETQKDLLAL